jgi:hypothetical protein
MTYSRRNAAAANREFDRKMATGKFCAACAAEFGTYHANYGVVVERQTTGKHTDCCKTCARDLE